MKSFVVIFALSFACVFANLQCEQKKPNIPSDWIDMSTPCVLKIRNHVMKEIRASLQYLAMAAYFFKDQINKPGFAEFFLKASREKRDRAFRLIHYLLMRGELTSNVCNMITRRLAPSVTVWVSGATALRDALVLESAETKKIRNIITVCENDPTFNDYHLTDYLNDVFLNRQYHCQRTLAGKLSNLQKLSDQHGAFAEYIYDKELLKAEYFCGQFN